MIGIECWAYVRDNLEKAMATHSSTLAWKIPWMEESGRLQSMGAWRVRHDWVSSFSLFTFMNWRRKWQPTSVFLPGESQGQRSLVGYHLWGCTEWDMTEAEVEWFCEDQDLLKPKSTPKKKSPFHHSGLECIIGSQRILTGKFNLRV